MKIEIAKTSGFCFGVGKAVKTVDELLKKGEKVCTLGQIIHNPHVVEDFENRGVKVVNSVADVPLNYIVVLRSHGCTKQDMEYINSNKIRHVDATCPFVKKIHKIVEENSDKKILFAAGNDNHPEMIGILSYFSGKKYVFKSEDELKEIINKTKISPDEKVFAVSQTTFNSKEWLKCTELMKKTFTNINVYDTICNTTNLRQLETENLSKLSDLMIVVGGKNSSNTLKLYDICRKNAPTIFIEAVDELPKNISKEYSKIGIVAGASTPKEIVEQIKKCLEEVND